MSVEVKDLEKKQLLKAPGSCEGQDCAVQSVSECDIKILNNLNAVSIDQVTNSSLVFGPTNSCKISICRDSSISIISSEIFLENCQNLKLFCATDSPIKLKNSTGISIFKFNKVYQNLKSVTQKDSIEVISEDEVSTFENKSMEEVSIEEIKFESPESKFEMLRKQKLKSGLEEAAKKEKEMIEKARQDLDTFFEQRAKDITDKIAQNREKQNSNVKTETENNNDIGEKDFWKSVKDILKKYNQTPENNSMLAMLN